MNRTSLFRAATIGLLLFGLLPIAGFGQGENADPPRGGRMGMFRELKEKLQITPEQEKQIRTIHEKYMRSRIQLRADLQIKRLDARQIAEADNADRAALEKKLEEIAAIQTQQKLSMFDEMKEVQKILTPEQMSLWKEHRAELRPGMMNAMRRHRGWER